MTGSFFAMSYYARQKIMYNEMNRKEAVELLRLPLLW